MKDGKKLIEDIVKVLENDEKELLEKVENSNIDTKDALMLEYITRLYYTRTKSALRQAVEVHDVRNS